MGRVGFLGGTFDPPHLAHLLLAEQAREQLQLDSVLFVPVGDPPHKQKRPITSAYHRINMLQLAIENHPQFTLSTIDVDRPPPHYTATLLPYLQKQLPEQTLFLIMGADSLHQFPNWYQPRDILRSCQLAVLNRPGTTVDLANLISQLPEIETKLTLLEGITVNLSSTQLRQRIKKGESVRYMIPDSVRSYILLHQLYE